MLAVFWVASVVLTGAIFGDTIIKDNPARFKAISTDANGKQMPASGEMDTIQVFDIHPAGDNYTDPGISIDINVTPLNEINSTVHPPTNLTPAIIHSNPDYYQVGSTFDLPSDYSKVNYTRLPATTFDQEATPMPSHQSDNNPATLVTSAAYPASPAGVIPMPDHWNKATLPYLTVGQRENPAATPQAMKGATDINPFADTLPAVAANSYTSRSGINPLSGSYLQNASDSQNPYSMFPIGGLQTAGNSTFTTVPSATPHNPYDTARNLVNISSTLPAVINPGAPSFGQLSNPFSAYNPIATAPGQYAFNFLPTNAFPSMPYPFASATNGADSFGSVPVNPFNFTNPFANVVANPFESKFPPGNPFNPLTPTPTPNILPLGGTPFNQKNPFPAGGFPVVTTPNQFLPNFGGAGKSLFGGKPNRVFGPNPGEDILIVPPAGDVTVSSRKQPSLLSKLFHLFGSSKNLSDHKTVDDAEIISDDSAPAGNSNMMTAATGNGNTDFINPSIYKAYFDPSMWNRFTNLTNFDESGGLGNPNNPFAAFNPAGSPLTFLQNMNPWSPGNVNNPWNPKSLNQALLNLTSLMKAPVSGFGADFNFPASEGANPWVFNNSAPGVLEISRNGSWPEFSSFSVLKHVNTSLLPPVTYSPNSSTEEKTTIKLPMSHLNVPANTASAINISDLMKTLSESIDMLSGNSSQAVFLKSLGENVEMPSATWPQYEAVPLPAGAAAFGVAAKPSTYVQSVKGLKPLVRSRTPIDIETIPLNAYRNDNKEVYRADSSKAGADYEETTNDTAFVNGTTVTEAPQNGAIVFLSSWMMVIEIVVGVITQKIFN